MATHDAVTFHSDQDPQLLAGNPSVGAITQALSEPLEAKRPPAIWLPLFVVCNMLAGMTLGLIGYLLWEGVGVWGMNNPAGWGFDIVNFVYWIGLGHAGTFISSMLYLLRQPFRSLISRFAEAMTIYGIMMAGMFPGIHLGRAWLAYWFFPLPNQMALWPNWRSPLLWDFFALNTYAFVSLIFWYLGLIPDFATIRDRATQKWRQVLYGILACGWRNSQRQWHHYESAYTLLGGIACALVCAVSMIVSTDFSTGLIPGWHTTIFPPYFVCGALLCGFAFVVLLAAALRKIYHLEAYFTLDHFESFNKIILMASWFITYIYASEIFIAYYSGNIYEKGIVLQRMLGPYHNIYWTMVILNVLVPQIFWFRAARRNLVLMCIVAVLINIGMWCERFVIVVTPISTDFMPSAWDVYRPTLNEIGIFAGSFGMFFILFLIFVRYVPMIGIAEVKTIQPRFHPHSAPAAD